MFKSLMIVASLAFAVPALAQTPSDARLAADLARNDRQDARLNAGVAAGSINAREAAYLDRRLDRTDRTTNRLAADGRYSRVDAARVDRRQDTSSRQIRRARLNRR